MEWFELKVTVDTNDADALANFLIESGSNGIVEDTSSDKKKTTLTSYFENNDTFSSLHESIKNYLDGLYRLKDSTDNTPPEITIDQIPDEDWNKKWKSFFEPIKITDRIVIKPSWRKYLKKNNEIIIELDPLFGQFQALFFGKHVDGAIILNIVKIIQSVDALSNCLEIRQHTTQPAIVDVKHFTPIGLLINGFASLLFGANKKH